MLSMSSGCIAPPYLGRMVRFDRSHVSPGATVAASLVQERECYASQARESTLDRIKMSGEGRARAEPGDPCSRQTVLAEFEPVVHECMIDASRFTANLSFGVSEKEPCANARA